MNKYLWVVILFGVELTHVLPGTYTLQVLGDNGQPVDSKSVTVGDGTTVNVEI